MRGSKAIGVAAFAATLCLGIGVTAAGGAGASTPAKKAKPVLSPKVMEANAFHTAVAALSASSHIKSKAARTKAELAAIHNLESAIKAATAHVKPTAAALKEEKSPQFKKAVKELTHPGSLARGQHVKRSGGRQADYGSGFSTSSNWSGYVDTNGSYNYVFGEWTVPSANCGPWYDFNFSQSSTWVGLDGSSSSTVEQEGTATGCIAGASAYYAWTEMYPQIEDPIWEPVSPGDQVMALTYSYNNGTADELWMADLTQGWSWVRYASTSQVADSSAEWITEDPSCGPFCNNLTNFGTTTFTDAYAIGNNTFGSISSFPNYMDDMYKNNTYCAEVGGLVNGGTQFTDWFIHS
jgi:hypothetical protein